MIGVDLIGQIRRAYFEQHRSIKEIVRTLSVSRATVQVQTTARYAHLAEEPIRVAANQVATTLATALMQK
jgi:paraquat-inducible protein B